MERVGIRELRQNASVWLRRVQAGASFEVTDRGRPVARLVPITQEISVDGLVARGALRRPERARADIPRAVSPMVITASELLADLRSED